MEVEARLEFAKKHNRDPVAMWEKISGWYEKWGFPKDLILSTTLRNTIPTVKNVGGG